MLLSILAGCAPEAGLPAPRPLVNSHGARLRAEAARMAEVDTWVQKQSIDISQDPSFLISTVPGTEDLYMWEATSINAAADTAVITLRRSATDAQTPYRLYAHFHLMERAGRLDEYLPEGVGLTGYDLERAILKRVADAWLYGRAIFDLSPYGPLDELMYASENGWLDAYILTARADEFPEERRLWLDGGVDVQEDYRAWFRQTFDEEPPGIR